MGSMPMSVLAHSHAPYADAATQLFGPWAGWVMALAAIIAALGALNGWILLQGKVPYAAALHGLFPRVFSKINRVYVPWVGLLVGSCLGSIFLMFSLRNTLVEQFTFIILVATFATLIAYLYASLSEVMICVNSATSISKAAWIRMVSIAMVAFFFCVWVILGSGAEIIYAWMVLFLASLPLYVWVKSQNQSKVLNHVTES